MSEPGPPKVTHNWALYAAAASLAVLLVVALGLWLHQRRLEARLVMIDPDQAAADPRLVRLSPALAKPAYARHCASCHGAEMQGDQRRGAPRLNDQIWLYGNGDVADLERTILYGIRSGDAKSRNITDMPPLGRSEQLNAAEVRDVTTFVLSLTHPITDPGAVQRGAAIFQGKGSCYDCHSSDARGNPDYGSPAFTDNDWLYGGDFDTVYRSIYSGRHGVCPAWIGKLRPAVIRGLAVYLHTITTPPAAKANVHD